jgi:hypothetical protein
MSAQLREVFSWGSNQETDPLDLSGNISGEEDEDYSGNGGIKSTDRSQPLESKWRQQTLNQRETLEGTGSLSEKALAVIETMRESDINLAVFLDALFWGCEELIDNGLTRWQRTCLLQSRELPGILQRMYKPPAKHNQSGGRGLGGRSALAEWADGNVTKRIDDELRAAVKRFRQPPRSQFLEENSLAGIRYKDLIKEEAPTSWKLFRACAYTPQQEKRNHGRDPSLVCTALYI